MTNNNSQTRRLQLQPRLHDGVYVYCCATQEYAIPTSAVCVVCEPEGNTLILPEQEAQRLELKPGFRAAWITLDTQTNLTDVGITAVISQALAEQGISCNMVAGYYHDHLFVPAERGEEAIRLIAGL
ncbi:MAG: ACT domain-containing protein [Planctomycetia bacterium]|nr:ACT domain-containing protein [Planctomycetia bacterium]